MGKKVVVTMTKSRRDDEHGREEHEGGPLNDIDNDYWLMEV